MERKYVDLEAIKTAVEAVLYSSDTLMVGIREQLRAVDMNIELNYSHGREVERLGDKINGKLQDFIGEIENMIEEREKWLADEQERQLTFNTCRICLCDMSEHNWEAHVQEMKADLNG